MCRQFWPPLPDSSIPSQETRNAGKIHRKDSAGGRINQEFGMTWIRARKGVLRGRQITSRSHRGEMQALSVTADVTHVVPHVVPTPIRRRTNSVDWRWTKIALFPRIKDHVRV